MKELRLNTFPGQFSSQAVTMYIVLLTVVTLVFFKAAMSWYWMVFGIVEVWCFFHFSNVLPKKWAGLAPRLFKKKLFKTSLTIRVLYVFFSYAFYWIMTESTFDFESADVLFYHEMGQIGHIMIREGWNDIFKSLQATAGGLDLGDMGYPCYLTLIYTLTGDSIIITRLIKALLSAYTCVMIYKFAFRNFGDETARLAGIMCMVMPNLIYYCGIHLKETEMVFLLVLFVERVDLAMRSIRINWKILAEGAAAALLLFLFRNALAVVALMAFGCFALLSSGKVLSRSKKAVFVSIMVTGLLFSVGGNIYRETVSSYQNVSEEQARNMYWRSERENGNLFAQYAGKSVFLPLIFTIPFPTMVNIEHQQNQQMIHGGNFVKNITSGITIYALFLLLFTGEWRKYVLPLAVMCGYLLVVALSNFAQSERFHLPALPFALMFAAYGLTHLRVKIIPWYKRWLIFIFIANIGWAWFKLAGRGMIL